MTATNKSSRKHRRAQAMVEFALVLILAVIVLFGSVQLALIGQLALALGQMNYQGVRYAAVSPDCINERTPCGLSNQSITQYMLSVASPTIVSITNANANALKVNYSNVTNPGVKRLAGDTVKIACILDISSKIFLPNLGLPFPTSLTHTEQAFTE
jgi:hypothetical protein